MTQSSFQMKIFKLGNPMVDPEIVDQTSKLMLAGITLNEILSTAVGCYCCPYLEEGQQLIDQKFADLYACNNVLQGVNASAMLLGRDMSYGHPSPDDYSHAVEFMSDVQGYKQLFTNAIANIMRYFHIPVELRYEIYQSIRFVHLEPTHVNVSVAPRLNTGAIHG